MNLRRSLLFITLFASMVTTRLLAQGTFQNLDFEDGIFIPIPSDPFGSVQFSPAMPGWTGFVGTNQTDWILHNNLFLSTAGIAISGPDQQPAQEFHGHYYIVLQAGNDPFGGLSRVNSAITQTGTIPDGTQSIQFYLASGAVQVSFAGQQIPMTSLGSGGSSISYSILGGDISAFAGQNGLLQIRGVGYLDYIQFSNQVIPEPSTLGLFGLGALIFGSRSQRTRKS